VGAFFALLYRTESLGRSASHLALPAPHNNALHHLSGGPFGSPLPLAASRLMGQG
jgi:hypothetical protein